MSYLLLLFTLLLSPLLLGIINRTKAIFAGRQGQPLLQTYHDLTKLLQKGAVYSQTTSWVFRLGPTLGLAGILGAATLVPWGHIAAPVTFAGDIFLFVYLLALVRFLTVLAALDTGSSFEGMGASREVQFAIFCEPAFFLTLGVLAYLTQSLSLSHIFSRLSPDLWLRHFPALLLSVSSLSIIFLTENSRIPLDDPNTHLELTMIHEVMVLDHSGPDLAFILYGTTLKMWLLGSLIISILLPIRSGFLWFDGLLFILGMGILAILTGVVESVMARLRLVHIPKFLAGATALAALALILVLR